MNEYANSLKQTLTSLIREMSAAPAPYVKSPEKDFTRKKKLPFETVMQLLISMMATAYQGTLYGRPFPHQGQNHCYGRSRL
ncbi:hypothetical protein [Paenibacillus andongensis]|uniref:hypothetical protein n=1 Tax=Paenibacillus andongensis TaxID=2975482 RepID=UPI0021BBA869|nr:hypothetical protein [Paenibacillus andongensis]